MNDQEILNETVLKRTNKLPKKKYKCQFCDFHGTKEELIDHVEDKHEEMIPEGFTAARTVFNHIYKKTHGTCIVCKRPTPWNEERCKYDRLCGKPSCLKKYKEMFKNRMLKVYGKENLLDDPNQQEKMLSHRRISGSYKFMDGGAHIYTGSYEKKTLEFLDKIMHFKSTDILSPGPILEYEFKGKKLKWITDLLLIPYNLIIEVKDGEGKIDKRRDKSVRDKTLAKEEMITNLGKFHYLRLTNNNFEQLLEMLAELKFQMMDDTDENKKVIINIHEEVEGLRSEVTDLSKGAELKPKEPVSTNLFNPKKQNVLIQEKEPLKESVDKFPSKDELVKKVMDTFLQDKSFARWAKTNKKKYNALGKEAQKLVEEKYKFLKKDYTKHRYIEKATVAALCASLLTGCLTTIPASAIGAFVANHLVNNFYGIKESMGLAAATGGAMVGTGPAKYFITNYTMAPTFTSNLGIANDLITDNILTRDPESGMLILRKTSTLEDCKIKMYAVYLSPIQEQALYSHIFEQVSPDFIYSVCTGHERLLCEDQLDIDPMLTPVDINLEQAKTNSIIQTLFSEYYEINGNKDISVPLMDIGDLDRAHKLNGYKEEIAFYESPKGYYAENVLTRKRTSCYKNIDDIRLEVL